MHMLRHDDIADDNESIAAARLLECLKKEVAPKRGRQQSPAAIATGSDEVKVARAIISLETIRHPRIVDPSPQSMM
jgi:hypothetical protein